MFWKFFFHEVLRTDNTPKKGDKNVRINSHYIQNTGEDFKRFVPFCYADNLVFGK